MTQQSQTTLCNSYLRLGSLGTYLKMKSWVQKANSGVLSGDNLYGGKEGRIGQREKLMCSEVAPEASASPTGALEVGRPFRVVPVEAKEPDVCIPLFASH